MRLNRRFFYVELLADLPIGVARDHQAQHLAFSLTQL
jgi:hypothetical protein